MISNSENLQTLVNQFLIDTGQVKAIYLWGFLNYFFILLLFFLAVNQVYNNTSLTDIKGKNGYSTAVNSDLFYCIAVALCIITLRFPLLSKPESNVDESQWIAAAITLKQDSRYWLSVDGTTSGPLVSAPLLLISLFGGTINYGTVKLFGIFIWVLSIILIYKSLRLFLQKVIARLTILPLVFCVSSFTFWDYIAYNSEHIPILLLSACIFLSVLITIDVTQKKTRYIILLGFLLGCIPYSKLQAVPMALSMTLYIFLFVRLRLKIILLFIGFGLLPSILILIYLIIIGIFNDFWISYIINNLIYAKVGLGHNFTFFQKIKYFPNLFFKVRDTNYFFLSQIIFSTIGTFILLIKFRNTIERKEYKLIGFAFILLITSIYSVIQPGNDFYHYLLLLIVPFAFLTSVLTGILYNKFSFLSFSVFNQHLLIISGTILFITSVIYFNSRNTSVFAKATLQLNTKKDRVTRKILYLATPGDKIAVWGWANKYYAETQLAQGCRDPHFYYQIKDSPTQQYYLNRYVYDIRKNKPTFFLDAVSDTNTQSYKRFPQIKNIVDSLYRHLEKVDGVDIYIKKQEYTYK